MFGMKSRAKYVLGRLAAKVYPSLAQEALSGNINGPKRKLKMLIARAELASLQSSGDSKRVQSSLTARWKSENLNANYYDHSSDRFDRMFHGSHACTVDWLIEFNKGVGIRKVIEVGCGDGRALAEMSQRIPEISTWLGIDINKSVIARNIETYAEQRSLSFVAADATVSLDEHAEQGTLLMTYGGVMEYVSPDTLRRWFSIIKNKGGAGILLTEPLDHNHDLLANHSSYLWGHEASYSHNHRALLETEGYRVLHSAEEFSEGYRTVMMLAKPEI